ncbi:MAG TPA: hypothetical protein VNX86_15090 [Rhizomicrobium sp.]|nr:hypothetical protein [Rhizomicrobium sp.]
MTTKSICVGLFAGVAMASLGSCLPAEARSRFTVIDVPGASFTVAESISDGTITGYSDGSGFVRTPDGTFTEFSAPNAVFGTFPVSVNNGAVTGYYVDSSGVNHGFVRATDGTITEFDASGSGGTSPASINKRGLITGTYVDGNNSHGFVRAADGTITMFDAPKSTYTLATGINADGTITGSYSDGSALLGFVRATDGTFTTFNAGSSGNNDVFSIDSKGQVAGYYMLNNDGVPHGFMRRTGGKIISFDPPRSVYTVPLSIDSSSYSGAIVGYYKDSSGNYHGFLRSP